MRHAMRHPAVAALAQDRRLLEVARGVLGWEAFPFRATLFDKSPHANWLVVWHQDTALPLRKRRNEPGWGPWSVKENVIYAHAPSHKQMRPGVFCISNMRHQRLSGMASKLLWLADSSGLAYRLGWAVHASPLRHRARSTRRPHMRRLARITLGRGRLISRSPDRTRTRPPVSTTSCTANTRPAKAAGFRPIQQGWPR